MNKKDRMKKMDQLFERLNGRIMEVYVEGMARDPEIWDSTNHQHMQLLSNSFDYEDGKAELDVVIEAAKKVLEAWTEARQLYERKHDGFREHDGQHEPASAPVDGAEPGAGR